MSAIVTKVHIAFFRALNPERPAVKVWLATVAYFTGLAVVVLVPAIILFVVQALLIPYLTSLAAQYLYFATAILWCFWILLSFRVFFIARDDISAAKYIDRSRWRERLNELEEHLHRIQ